MASFGIEVKFLMTGGFSDSSDDVSLLSVTSSWESGGFDKERDESEKLSRSFDW